MSETTVTYLEMFEGALAPAPDAPCEGLTILHAVRPTVAFYRFLYGTVGARWQWVDRLKLTEERLAGIIQHPEVQVHVMYVGGVPAGYIELDFRHMPEVEVAYFGIMPEFIGRRLGSYLLRFGVYAAWRRSPRRVWPHTCTLDHPRALDTYLRAGKQ